MLFNNRIHIVEPTITEGFGCKFSIISQGRRIWLQVQYYQSRQKDLAASSVLSVTIGFGCKFSIISQDRRILAAISDTIEGFGSDISHDRRIWLQVQYYQSRQKDLAASSVLSVTIKGFGCKFSIISQDRRILAAISDTIEGFGSDISHDRRIWLQVQYYQSRQKDLAASSVLSVKIVLN